MRSPRLLPLLIAAGLGAAGTVAAYELAAQGGSAVIPCGPGLGRMVPDRPCDPLFTEPVVGREQDPDGTVKLFCRSSAGEVRLCLIDRP